MATRSRSCTWTTRPRLSGIEASGTTTSGCSGADVSMLMASILLECGVVKPSTSLMTVLILALAGCLAPAASPYHQVAVTLPNPATLSAELHLPRGTGPFPTLILLHGCGGIGPNLAAWAQWLTWE